MPSSSLPPGAAPAEAKRPPTPRRDSTATTEAPADDSEEPADTTAPEPDDSDDEPTSADVTTEQLEALFPEASEVGPGYEGPEIEYGSDSSSDDEEADDETDEAFKEQCPKAAELDFLNDVGDANEDDVTATYVTEAEQEIEISLDPTPAELTEENLELVVEAWNDCGTVEINDPATGPMKMDLAAESLDGIGDFGADITMNAEFELFGMPLNVTFRGYMFVVNDVAVMVTAASGLDDETMEPSPGDDQLLEPLSQLMQERVESLTD